MFFGKYKKKKSFSILCCPFSFIQVRWKEKSKWKSYLQKDSQESLFTRNFVDVCKTFTTLPSISKENVCVTAACPVAFYCQGCSSIHGKRLCVMIVCSLAFCCQDMFKHRTSTPSNDQKFLASWPVAGMSIMSLIYNCCILMIEHRYLCHQLLDHLSLWVGF